MARPLHEQLGQPQTAEYFEGIWRGADTLVLGRIAYEGFYSVWPGITRDEGTEPRTRDLGRWLEPTEKVVISRTLTEAPWENSRVARDLPAEIDDPLGDRRRHGPGSRCDRGASATARGLSGHVVPGRASRGRPRLASSQREPDMVAR